MIARLADALEMPLRERNGLLIAAGYAPQYRETALNTPEMAQIRRAIEFIVQQQEPYPAFVTNRYWDVVLINQAVPRLFTALRGRAPIHANLVRQIFDPQDMRPVLRNWQEVAGDVIRLLHDQVAAAPSDARARALLDEVLAFPGVPEQWHVRDPGAAPSPLMNSVFGRDELEVRFFSTITTFGTPRDVTLDELRIECMFPADEATAQVCRNLAS